MKFFSELSAFRDRAPRVEALDACHVGVVLRALAVTLAGVAVASMFGAHSVLHGLERLALASAGVVPAVLGWLLLACALGRMLGPQRRSVRDAMGLALGAAAGALACAILDRLVPWPQGAPWLAAALAGALWAGAVQQALDWHARSRAPADVAARLAGLQARIAPHFLFNTLNAAIALVREDPARAEGVLQDLSDLFRQALADPAQAVSLADEVALARGYLRIEQVRFGERLRVHWSLDPRADHARVPPLVLQPLVENAVKHGVQPSARGAQVHVCTQRRRNHVVITITNTVPDGPGPAGCGVALANVRERLRLLHDVHGRFQAGLRDGVFRVSLEVPA